MKAPAQQACVAQPTCPASPSIRPDRTSAPHSPQSPLRTCAARVCFLPRLPLADKALRILEIAMTSLTIRPATIADTDLILHFVRELAIYKKPSTQVLATPAHVHRTLFCDNPRCSA